MNTYSLRYLKLNPFKNHEFLSEENKNRQTQMLAYLKNVIL